jgi:hypothetical protein
VLRPAIGCFEIAEHARCADAEAVLVGLGKKCHQDRAVRLLSELIANWWSLSGNGKNSALAVARVLVDRACETERRTNPVPHLAGDLLKYAVQDVSNRRAALMLAAALERVAPEEMARDFLNDLAVKGLASEDEGIRAAALHLFLYPPLSEDSKLLAKALPHVRDSSSQVRRVAILTFGANQDLLAEDDLLPLLHDKDAEVRRLCEMALRSRGLTDEHVFLARLISDERPTSRLEILHYVHQIRDLDPGVWLKRLCQDSSPAVRAAAVRAAASQSRVDLTAYLRDIARQDSSPTVRQIASFYTSLDN